MQNKNGKIVLITGGNKGLGKETARQLSLLGYTVVITSRNKKSGDAVVAELNALNGDVHCIQADVTNAEDIKTCVNYIQSTFGKLDVLVNNAGIAIEWDGNPTNADKIRQTLEVNLIAPFAMTEALVPLLTRSSDARVINQSSILGSIDSAEKLWNDLANFMAVGYSTSKTGLNMLTLIQSKSLEKQGIIVAASHPGWVKTDMGTDAAPMQVNEGASTVVTLVTMPRDKFPNGQLVHKMQRIAW
jgi:NAD(P)-dependent dehydrogenase (short-subunit alcohol dehydrogenase family)